MSSITEALAALASGDKTLDEVEEIVRNHEWPTTRGPAADGQELLRRTATDDEPAPEGSFAEIEQAFINGTISTEQYSRLAAAAVA